AEDRRGTACQSLRGGRGRGVRGRGHARLPRTRGHVPRRRDILGPRGRPRRCRGRGIARRVARWPGRSASARMRAAASAGASSRGPRACAQGRARGLAAADGRRKKDMRRFALIVLGVLSLPILLFVYQPSVELGPLAYVLGTIGRTLSPLILFASLAYLIASEWN